jgi:O-antigen/teichoic acid export membrane protein
MAMKELTSTTRVRWVLRAGSTIFGLSALLLIAAPTIFNNLLGLSSTPQLEWAMRMIGVTLVALAGNMFSVANRGSEASVRFSARVMQGSAFALGVLTLLLPAQLNWFSILYAVIGFGFSASYTWAMLGKR